MSAVLVTGATGFVGSWLTRRLLQDGHQVSVLCRNEKSLDPDLRSNCIVIRGDITEPEDVEKAAKDIDVVYHLAGFVGYSEDLRDEMEKVNVLGTQNILSACRKNGVKDLVYMSSVVAIGASFSPVVLNEDDPYTVSHLNLGYFETKRTAEQLVIKANEEKEIRAFILNPSTIYGPGDFKKGSRKIQLKVARGKFPFYTGGGVNVVSIRDVIEAAIKIKDLGSPGERYIISGENLSIKELFQKIAAARGIKAPQILLPNFMIRLLGKIGKIPKETSYTSTMFHWFDNTKAKNQLRMDFKNADFAIQESINWLNQHEDEV